MYAEHENARRHANNTIAEANRHLDSGKIKNPQHHQMLNTMIKDATDTLNNLDRMNDARPYSRNTIGYNADMRYNDRDNMRRMLDDTMDAINRILPHIAGDYNDDAEARRGVPGSGRGRSRRMRVGGYTRRAPRSDMEDMDDMDDMDDMKMRRRRDSRGRFMDADHEQRTYDAVARAAADTARRMTNDIYPNVPVMPRNDTRNDADYTRSDNTTSEHKPGPSMRR